MIYIEKKKEIDMVKKKSTKAKVQSETVEQINDETKDWIKGYKVFDENWACNAFQYEFGKVYEMPKEQVSICNSGFHFCLKCVDCFNYKEFKPTNKIAEVIVESIIQEQEDKCVTNKIKIVKEITWEEMLKLCNLGRGNSGLNNSGHCNSGDNNSGHCNSGNRNSGHYNSGNRNSGDNNSGHCNSGDNNSGHCNSGHYNSGHRNSGNRNSGHRNSGHCNSGDNNSGHCNSGHCNSGDNNSGHCNSGNRNSGHCNSGDNNSGHFNTITPTEILVFNKPCLRSVWEEAEKPSFFYNLNLTRWISSKMMSDIEKTDFPQFKTLDGYLQKNEYKKAWIKVWETVSDQDKVCLKKLPNFNAQIFEEITGIHVE
jgi:hypothetical protein